MRELAAMLDERERGERDFDLIDVREPGEYEIVRIPGARLVPQGSILSGRRCQPFRKAGTSCCTARRYPGLPTCSPNCAGWATPGSGRWRVDYSPGAADRTLASGVLTRDVRNVTEIRA